ncbi:MAG: thrombospondin type 3 repeat-containing protein [Sandaracinaceae bacterium]|nr:thrombospondin type 3 repeat-containing protein [Sandaracinaceae bacterium]
MKAALALTACLALVGCDGLGRPIVGTRPISDGGGDDSCDLTPMCRPLRAADPSALSVPLERLSPERFADCDDDGVGDAMDNCPGVPNEDQRDVCATARSACDRLRAGDTGSAYTDLRGCRIEEPLAVGVGFSLAEAQLDCASLTIVGPESAQPALLELGQASLRRASLTLESGTPWIADASRAQLRGSFLRLRGGARLRAHEAVLSDARVVIEPGTPAAPIPRRPSSSPPPTWRRAPSSRRLRPGRAACAWSARRCARARSPRRWSTSSPCRRPARPCSPPSWSASTWSCAPPRCAPTTPRSRARTCAT